MENVDITQVERMEATIVALYNALSELYELEAEYSEALPDLYAAYGKSRFQTARERMIEASGRTKPPKFLFVGATKRIMDSAHVHG